MSHKRRYPARQSPRRPLSEPLEPRRLLAATSYVIDTSNAVDLGTLQSDTVIPFDFSLSDQETHKVFKLTVNSYRDYRFSWDPYEVTLPYHARFLADINSDGLIELSETISTNVSQTAGRYLPAGTVYLVLSESAPTLAGYPARTVDDLPFARSIELTGSDGRGYSFPESPTAPIRTGPPGDYTDTYFPIQRDDGIGIDYYLGGTVSQENPHDRIVVNLEPGKIQQIRGNASDYFGEFQLGDPASYSYGFYRIVDGVSTLISYADQKNYDIISQANQFIVDVRFNLDWSTLTDPSATAPIQGAAAYGVAFSLVDATSQFDLVPEIPNFITFDGVDSEYAYFRVAGDPINSFDFSGPSFPNNLYYEDNNTPGLQYIPDSNRDDDKVFGWANVFKVPRSASGNYTFYRTNTPIPSHDGYRANTITYTFPIPSEPAPPPSVGQPLQVVPASPHTFTTSPFSGVTASPGAFTLASQRQNTPLATSIRLINVTSATLPISHIAVMGDFKITGRLPTSIPANSEVLITLTASTKIPKMLMGSIGVYTGDSATPVTANITSYITPTPPRTTPSDRQVLVSPNLVSYAAPRKPTPAQPFSKATIDLWLPTSLNIGSVADYKGPVRVVFYLSNMPIGEVLIPSVNLSRQKPATVTVQPPAPALSASFQSFDPNQTYTLTASAIVGSSIDGPPAKDSRFVLITQTALPPTTTDLRPTLSAPKSLKLTGKPTSLKLTLENLGTALLTDRVTVKLFHSADNLLSTEGDNPADLLLGTFSFDISLAAGKKKTFTLRTTLPPIPPGQSFLLATATGLTSDNNPNNNTATPASPTLFRT